MMNRKNRVSISFSFSHRELFVFSVGAKFMYRCSSSMTRVRHENVLNIAMNGKYLYIRPPCSQEDLS